MQEKKIIDVLLDATRYLHRDYFELEMFRNYNSQTIQFCDKSISKVEYNLQQSFAKHYDLVLFNNEELEKGFVGDYVQINSIGDSILNYQRSLPFFAININIINVSAAGSKQATSSVLYFPALNEIYFAKLGKGAWREKLLGNDTGKFRLKISQNAILESALVACDVRHIESLMKISKNLRIFGSNSYSLILFLSGKVDIAALDHQDLGNNLFIQEAGGMIRSFGDFYIATNEKLNKLLSR